MLREILSSTSKLLNDLTPTKIIVIIIMMMMMIVIM